jgi:hypothetical protein
VKHRGLVIVAALLVSCAMATPSLASGPHPYLRGLFVAVYFHRHHGGGAPAPLLAAGIPAFLALGGGAATTSLVRRFRNQKA